MARGLDPVLVGAYDAQTRHIAGWLAALTDDALARPSLLEGWRVAELAAHLTLSGRPFPAAVAAARPGRGVAPITVAAYVAGYAAAADEIRERERLAAQGFSLDDARQRFAESVAAVRAAVAELGGTDPVVAARRGPIRASDLLRTRVLELVVHALDVSPGPEIDRQAERVVVRMLADVLAERHPGRAVEVRVPPYAAVQVGEGLRHTRGTPPNVVECSPRVFVAVVSGRRAWSDAVAAGDVRASGGRADLGPYLPLL